MALQAPGSMVGSGAAAACLTWNWGSARWLSDGPVQLRGRRLNACRLQELRRGRVWVHAVLLEREAVLAVIVAVGGVAGCKWKWKWKWKGNEESG